MSASMGGQGNGTWNLVGKNCSMLGEVSCSSGEFSPRSKESWGRVEASAGEAQNSLDMELRVSPPCEEGTDNQENSWHFHDSRGNSISLWFWGKKNKLKLG